MLKAAFVGLGMAGHELARQVRERIDVQVVGGADASAAAAEQFCRLQGGVAYTSIGEMVRQQRPDLVVVASPNQAHAGNVISAIEAGARNIFCEKPLAIDIDDAARMVEAAERADVRTSMGFAGLERGISRMLEIVRSGLIGRPMHVHLHTYRGYGFWGQERVNQRGVRGRHTAVMHPEVSGGWTVHHACHMVYLLSQMVGQVRMVFGKLLTSTDDAPSEELINASLNFENGAIGTLLDSIGSFRGLHCGVIGTRGTLTLQDDMKKKEGSLAEVRIRLEGEDEDRIEHLPFLSPRHTRLAELIDAIRHDQPSPIPFREALDNLRVCHAIRQSSDTEMAIDMSGQFAKGRMAVPV